MRSPLSKRYRPARLDLNESGIIEKPLKRTSTAISFKFFIFTLEYFKKCQSPEPLHAKLNPISCLFGLRFACAQAVIFFHQTVFHKCGRGNNCSLDYGSQVKNFIIP